MLAWWHARNRAACGGGEGVDCGPFGAPGEFGGRGGRGHRHHEHGGHHEHGEGAHAHGGEGHGGDDFASGGFGVRRPLRFLAFKLDLVDTQVTELATVLNELKTERAQAVVDHRRTTSALADVVAAEAFDEAKAQAAAEQRVKSAERVEAAVARAIGRIHALLKPEQRSKLAYLLRTGALSM
jgi:Spy/CpxP family protein refolding chaperone